MPIKMKASLGRLESSWHFSAYSQETMHVDSHTKVSFGAGLSSAITLTGETSAESARNNHPITNEGIPGAVIKSRDRREGPSGRSRAAEDQRDVVDPR